MRIIAAEVAIAPENHPEVEVGMLPLDLDLPGPWARGPEIFLDDRAAVMRMAQGQALLAQRQATLAAAMAGSGRTVTVRLTLHTSRGDLTIQQQVALREEEPPEQSDATDMANLPDQQYRALARSMEQPTLSVPRDDDHLGGHHARLPHRPFAPCDHAMAVFPIA